MERILLFGEVLFDCLPSGDEVLGGAPFNVAWNLTAFGLAPLMLSRVGEDERGRQILERMSAWGMDSAGVHSDTQHPTGVAEITLQDGHAGFTLPLNQAYDNIKIDPAVEQYESAILYHGSLALRSPVSLASFRRLRELPNFSRFVDLNLRAPWWKQEHMSEYISGARWLKLNDEELEVVFGSN